MASALSPRRENTRARLRDAGAEVFAEVGLDGASVEAICERAGFTRGAFYSNFASKDELFLDLAATVAERRLVSVRTQIDEFLASGVLAADADPVELVQRVMDSGQDDRLSIQLMSEIRIRALRDADFADAYLTQERALLASIEDIIRGIVDSGLFVLRVDAAAAASLLMLVWEGTMVRGVIAGQDGERLHSSGSVSLGRVVELLIASTP